MSPESVPPPPSPLRMVDLHGLHAEIRDELDAAMADVVDSGGFIRGPVVAAFERDLADALDCAYAVGVGNGTDALQIAYMAAGLKPGDEIVTSAFSFIATAEAAALLGVRVRFVDIEPRTFNLDPAQIEAVITPRTRAIVPVHLFGQAADMDPILEIADRHGLTVIEDNAQSIGARYHGRPTGSLGHLSILSFFPSKNLGALGDGGAVLTNDPDLHARVRRIANHGAERKYHNTEVGVNSRLDALQAAVLRVKLRHLDQYSAARRTAADRYDALLAHVPDLVRPRRLPGTEHVFNQYTVRIDADATPDRDAVAAMLREAGVPTAIYYPVPLHRLPVFDDGHGPHLPVAERAAREVLSLPMHTHLTEAQQAFVADRLRSALELRLEPTGGVA